jgi:hypothetical protein
MGIGNFLTFGLAGKLFGGGKKSKDPYQSVLDKIAPYLGSQQQIADFLYGGSGKGAIESGLANLNIPLEFWKKVQSGEMSGDEVLQYLGGSELVDNQDENQMILENFGVRGGRRAADLSGTQVNRERTLQNAYQGLRQAAPDAIASLSQMLLGYGTQASGIALGGYGDIANSLLSQSGLLLNKQMSDAANKANIISSILGAIGSVAGFAACVVGDTRVLTSSGMMNMDDIYNEFQTNTIKLKASSDGARLVSIPINYVRKQDNCDIYEIKTRDGHSLKCTNEHFLITSLEPYIEKPISAFTLNDNVMLLHNGHIYDDYIKSINKLNNKDSVYIVKLGDEDVNYMFVTDGFLSIDDDVRLKGE